MLDEWEVNVGIVVKVVEMVNEIHTYICVVK